MCLANAVDDQKVPRQLRKRHAARRFERVDPHVTREVTGPPAGLHRLVGR
jgi:hypothetical protein